MDDNPGSELLSVMSKVGCRPDPDDDGLGRLEIQPHITSNGAVRPSALMLLADIVVGMRLETLIGDEWSFTSDFSIRQILPMGEGEVSARAVPLRRGRRLVVEQVEFTDAVGQMVAYCEITFIRVPGRGDNDMPDISATRDHMRKPTHPLLPAPLEQVAGIEVEGAGVATLNPGENVRRPGGFVQGAIMTLLGECAIQSLAQDHRKAPCVVTDLDVRFLIGGRTGPLVATAEWIGDPDSGIVRAHIVDQGHDNAITNTFLARTAPSPSGILS